ncbi:hypothetical protein TOPH_03013 [Tolypocladium ophioglossoides CBS 100239]|uniref:Uncharacterized protein n=1 Tax=Tolypocladium ophioglossoides (strain CBS 100239) TaxID=1163406 RepID=A0A0L0NEY1_TOLOC|nr:hypothetical protein TOPH_03013 [Tolypocladium ophioglossoides CBS 100239]
MAARTPPSRSRARRTRTRAAAGRGALGSNSAAQRSAAQRRVAGRADGRRPHGDATVDEQRGRWQALLTWSVPCLGDTTLCGPAQQQRSKWECPTACVFAAGRSRSRPSSVSASWHHHATAESAERQHLADVPYLGLAQQRVRTRAPIQPALRARARTGPETAELRSRHAVFRLPSPPSWASPGRRRVPSRRRGEKSKNGAGGPCAAPAASGALGRAPARAGGGPGTRCPWWCAHAAAAPGVQRDGALSGRVTLGLLRAAAWYRVLRPWLVSLICMRVVHGCIRPGPAYISSRRIPAATTPGQRAICPAPAMATHAHGLYYCEEQSRDSIFSSCSSASSYEYLARAPTSRSAAEPEQRRQRQQQQQHQQQHQQQQDERAAPTITFFPPSPSASASSVSTYDSLLSDAPLADADADADAPPAIHLPAAGDARIPPALPPYRADRLAGDPAPRPSDPSTFGRLFPSMDRLSANPPPPPPPPSPPLLVPTATIKLEFSNYARVDVSRRHGKRYEFAWWGRSYAWRRAVDKTLGTVSFHLVRDGEAEPVAHIVSEVRSPNQVDAEERAGGWIPPCYMWISDQSVVEAVTDVADVIVATGLIALVDDCIRERWQKKPAPPSPIWPHIGPADAHGDRSKTGVRGFFSRRPSTHSPLRLGRTIAVY